MSRVYWIVALALVALAWGAAALLYPGLPARVPTHWNLQGKVDGYGSKGTIFLLPGVMIGMLGLFRALPYLSPKNFEVDAFRETYLFAMVLAIGQMAYLEALLLGLLHGWRIDMNRAILGGLFLFFALLGNVLGRVRRNFYIGIRVPWTLASERVWNDTHRFAAWVFVACGLLGLLAVLARWPISASLGVLGVAVFVPIVYAFVHYKQLERRGAL
jgi:uncharacterized membrane protein